MRHYFYIPFGILLLAGTGWVQYYGAGGTWSVSEVRSVPKTVRDNPGAYRSHYTGSSRYFGGK